MRCALAFGFASSLNSPLGLGRWPRLGLAPARLPWPALARPLLLVATLALASAWARASASRAVLAPSVVARRFYLSAVQFGFVAARLVEVGVFERIRLLARASPASTCALSSGPGLEHSIIAHRLVPGGIGLDLRPVERNVTKVGQSRFQSFNTCTNRPLKADR